MRPWNCARHYQGEIVLAAGQVLHCQSKPKDLRAVWSRRVWQGSVPSRFVVFWVSIAGCRSFCLLDQGIGYARILRLCWLWRHHTSRTYVIGDQRSKNLLNQAIGWWLQGVFWKMKFLFKALETLSDITIAHSGAVGNLATT